MPPPASSPSYTSGPVSFLIRMAASVGTTTATAIYEIATARSAAVPNVRISADSANENEMSARHAFMAVRRQAGATSRTALRAASTRSMPAITSRRMANTRCIESEKPETRMSGVMTLMNRLSRYRAPQ